ncbi:hypothetical protein ACTQ54_12455, partial [Fundicoccus sp. Sow4_H7]|uniref:hypothetical protein n=1 Tax=Fundicoccus sp. Sow4_H7 TaxID=3438784 RepID=UPI003F9037AF
EQAEQYEFTTPDAGDNDAADSDADSEGYTIEFTLDETNSNITKEYDKEILATEGIDPTWDAGVILKEITPEPEKTYAVGDYVWIDADKDGVQNDSEVLPGVTVELLDG